MLSIYSSIILFLPHHSFQQTIAVPEPYMSGIWETLLVNLKSATSDDSTVLDHVNELMRPSSI